MKRASILILVAACIVVGCDTVDPTSPSNPQAPPIDESRATGQVVGIETPLSGIADVSITGAGPRTRTDARGFFTISANSSTYSLLLTHPNFVERRTAASLPASGL